ncbi:MAG: hypothetical protein GY943_30060 [Chloroflexi bacterium]|nr:hypothetical protein [Chloroflexota bacterium]
MNEWQWARKVDRDGIAGFVVPEWAAKVANLTLPETAFDLSGSAENRKQLAQHIYEGLLAWANRGQRIAYDQPLYNYEEDLQTIRTPEEILVAPREGTCLDLSLLYAGLCLHYGLLPLVIVLKGHAYVAVNLSHSRTREKASGWQSFGREELVAIEQQEGLLTDVAFVAQLIKKGVYLPVECTGFACTQNLPSTLPEGQGRFMGYLQFEQAVTAGTAQLDQTDRAFRYAAAIHYLHQKGVRPMSPADNKPTDESGNGDDIKVGNIKNSSGIAIGRGAKSTVTNKTTIDKSRHEHGVRIVAKDNAKIDISGNVAAGNITIGTMTHGSSADQDELEKSIAALNTELKQLGESHAAEVQTLEKRMNKLLAAAQEDAPDVEAVASDGNLVVSAAKKLAGVVTAVTTVLPLAEKIISLINGMIR